MISIPRAVRIWLLFAGLLLSDRVVVAADSSVLARGRGVEVTQAQLDEAFVNLRSTLAAKGRRIPEGERTTIERQLVEKLALTQLLMGKATEDDRKTAAEKVERLLEEHKAKAKTQARFDSQVRAAGLSPETFQEQLIERSICEEVLSRELRAELQVTPERVRRFYDERQAEFSRPARVRIRQVVFSIRDATGAELASAERAEKEVLAKRVHERLRRGEDIAVLARDFSDDPGGREREGEYVFPVGRMVPELETAVRQLKPGEVSDVVRSEFGYHVVKLEERLPGAVVPFEEVSTQLQSRMELEAMQEVLPKYQQRLFQEAGVEWLTRGE